MSYKCKRCGKTATYRSGLKCYKCDTQEAQAAGFDSPVYSSLPSYSDTTDTSSGSSSDSGYSGGGGDFGGGGASGDY